MQIPAALIAPALAGRRRRRRFWSGLVLGLVTIGTVGVLIAPDLPAVGPWLWVVLIGLGAGAGFPLGLLVIAWRTPDGTTSAGVSGTAMGIGYAVAALGPLLMGLLVDITGRYPSALTVLFAAAALQAYAIAQIGDVPGRAVRRVSARVTRAFGRSREAR